MHAYILERKMTTVKTSQKVVYWTAKNCGRCSTFCSLGTSILRAFLIIGWGFSSSSEKRCRRGSNASWPGTLDSARSAGSGSKFTITSLLLLLAAAGGPEGPGGQVEVGDWSWGTARPPTGGRKRKRRTQFVLPHSFWQPYWSCFVVVKQQPSVSSLSSNGQENFVL